MQLTKKIKKKIGMYEIHTLRECNSQQLYLDTGVNIG